MNSEFRIWVIRIIIRIGIGVIHDIFTRLFPIQSLCYADKNF